MKLAIIIVGVSALMSGCASHAPAVYSSRISIGLNIEPPGVPNGMGVVSLGFEVDDFAWVPYAFCKKQDATEAEQDATEAEQDATEAKKKECRIMSIQASTKSEQGTADKNRKKDSFSIYGKFVSDAAVKGGEAAGSTSGASLTSGKIFSTGVAAQNLSKGEAPGDHGRCLTLAKDGVPADGMTEDKFKALARLCNVTLP